MARAPFSLRYDTRVRSGTDIINSVAARHITPHNRRYHDNIDGLTDNVKQIRFRLEHKQGILRRMLKAKRVDLIVNYQPTPEELRLARQIQTLKDLWVKKADLLARMQAGLIPDNK